MSELKPCPFCGGDAHIGTVKYSRPLDDCQWDDGSPITFAYYAHCARCAAGQRNAIAGGLRTEAQAIAAWNTRATDADHYAALCRLDSAKSETRA